MEAPERTARMRRMRATVRYQNVYRWAGSLIGDLCDLRVSERKRAAAHRPDGEQSMATPA